MEAPRNSEETGASLRGAAPAKLQRTARLPFVLLLLYLAAQCWGIPVAAVPGVSWPLWPLPSDFVWLLMVPVLLHQTRYGSPRSATVARFSLSVLLFCSYSVLSFCFAWIRFGFPSSQVSYLAWDLFRLLQAYSLWSLGAHTALSPSAVRRLRDVATAAMLVVATSCLMQQFGLLDYRHLVSHLPANRAISGPWAYRVTQPAGNALGTLNYNRIATGYFLGTGALLLLASRRLRLVLVPSALVLLAALLATQSRTAMLAVAAGLAYLALRGRTVRVAAVLAIALLVSFALATGERREGVGDAGFAPRGDTFQESITGRIERHQAGIKVAFRDAATLVLGVGWGNLGYFWLGSGFGSAHGLPFTVLAELGVIGFVMLIRLYYQMFSALGSEGDLAVGVRAVLFANFATAPLNDLLTPNPAGGCYLAFLFCLAGIATRARSAVEATPLGAVRGSRNVTPGSTPAFSPRRRPLGAPL